MTRDEWLRHEIETFRKKIDTFQAFIAEYERELGLTPQSPSQTGGASGASKRTEPVHGDDPFTWIAGMIFFTKTQPEAAKIVLERVGYPLRTEQLMEAVQKGGVTIGGKTDTAKKQNFYTILNRNADFGRAKRDTWGLIGWPGISKKTPDEGDKASKSEQ
jgi:hypothetical protein